MYVILYLKEKKIKKIKHYYISEYMIILFSVRLYLIFCCELLLLVLTIIHTEQSVYSLPWSRLWVAVLMRLRQRETAWFQVRAVPQSRAAGLAYNNNNNNGAAIHINITRSLFLSLTHIRCVTVVSIYDAVKGKKHTSTGILYAYAQAQREYKKKNSTHNDHL